LVLFSQQRDLNVSDLIDAISEDVGANLSPDAIILVVRGDRFASIHSQLQALAADRSQWRVNLDVTSLVLLGFDAGGGVARQDTLAGPTVSFDAANFADAKRVGVLSIFKSRDGLLRPSATTHYIHPSGRHSRGFLRAANLLIEGAEVAFISMCLLEFVPTTVEYVWVDTSSISSLAYSLVLLRHEMDPAFEVPVVSSFSSYDRLDKARFGYHEKSLVLVSATTSGSMSRKLVEKGFAVDRVITLFSLASDKRDLTLFCDLSNDDVINPKHEFSAVADFVPADCPMCKSGSKPVRFVGDQFLADAISYSSYTIVSTDAPRDLGRVMQQFSGKRIFGVRAQRLSGPAIGMITRE
jgi:hypothetical protein